MAVDVQFACDDSGVPSEKDIQDWVEERLGTLPGDSEPLRQHLSRLGHDLHEAKCPHSRTGKAVEPALGMDYGEHEFEIQAQLLRLCHDRFGYATDPFSLT